MNVALWIVASLLAALFLFSGLMKLTQTREKMAASGYGFVEDVSDTFIRSIGVVEVLAAIGLILPAAVDIAPVFVPLAAVGVALLMVGAIVIHQRRKELQSVGLNTILLAAAVFVAWGRFGPHSF
ncbi:DoxX family protein [Streptomyces profundus]|uniref:DoxX family protein n=1 Tax=Streptomyces profundus TaxID=2867410 RepID=UPI001D15F191|nr:DoxX family protein [Streptomyces sp. MA3_2.13]UED85145.1 DoxX family protein [Streptomyces sp. MA3_2.13]